MAIFMGYRADLGRGWDRRWRRDLNAVYGYFGTARRRRCSRPIDRTGLFVRLAVFSAAVCVMPTFLHAENLPCSGRKAGIAMCRGDLFVCNDGSISASKKSCARFMEGTGGRTYGPTLNLTPPMASFLAPSSEGSCSCRSGSFCVGPRGGRFCLTDSGTKSYLRR